MSASAAASKSWAGPVPASLLLSLLALALWVSPALSQSCEWNRGQPWQVWRWFTGHFCHWSTEHFAWDVIAFLALSAICERRSRRGFLLCVGVSAFVITAAVWLLLPGITSYRGLSGLDSALFGWLTSAIMIEAIARRNRRLVAITAAFAFAFIGKLMIECASGQTVFVSDASSDFIPVPLAHAVGAVVGVFLNFVSSWFSSRPSETPPGSRPHRELLCQ